LYENSSVIPAKAVSKPSFFACRSAGAPSLLLLARHAVNYVSKGSINFQPMPNKEGASAGQNLFVYMPDIQHPTSSRTGIHPRLS